MKVIEVIEIHRELLKFMQKAGIRLSDVSYIELYEDYQSMTRQGLKVTYIVAYLSEKYSVSVRKVYMLVKRFKRGCKPFAV